jgi:hypothetical protein
MRKAHWSVLDEEAGGAVDRAKRGSRLRLRNNTVSPASLFMLAQAD